MTTQTDMEDQMTYKEALEIVLEDADSWATFMESEVDEGFVEEEQEAEVIYGCERTAEAIKKTKEMFEEYGHLQTILDGLHSIVDEYMETDGDQWQALDTMEEVRELIGRK